MGNELRNEMEDASNAYLNLLNDESVDRLTSMQRQEQETQVYWESENLQLRRQKNIGIKESLDLLPIQDDNVNENGELSITKEGTVQSGDSYHLVRVKRKIYRNNICIKEFKSECDCNVRVLKSDTNEQQLIACPNCGGYNSIESYIDGCDFCGAQFEVKDFKPKVSGFSLVENIDRMLLNLRSKFLMAYVIMFFISFLLTFGIIALSMHNMNNNTFTVTTNSLATFKLFSTWNKLLYVPFKGFMILMIGMIVFSAYKAKQSVIVNEHIPNQGIPNFSTADYVQELDHRIRTALMAENPEKSMVYADCNLTEFAKAHSGVFDACISKVIFKAAGYDENSRSYMVDADVVMKLYTINGNKVSESYEKISVTTSVAEQLTRKTTATIREYKCSGCGNGVNIFEGTHCRFCGNTIDKHSLGMVIENCTWMKQTNYYKVVPPIALVVAAILIII